ncbi:hypothetical protein Patl1_12669 [Pistacia atlantica]|uniref:Uncharacterized protein n=1 Tax=Pistacia atlantica TaxID=434234 RepID=A0ACC1AX74_9ROSI|nr:hypothetical protein Patl1_12669 [Pistacia atlantica]
MAFLFRNSRIVLPLSSLLILSFYSTALAQTSGIATFYTPPYMRNSDQGVMIAAASDTFWNGGAACGQYYQVTCVSGTNAGVPFPRQGSQLVVVKIVDHCPPGSCRGTIDLSQEAYASIADTASGAINIVEVLTESLTLKETPIPTKVARLMLVSDVLHNSSAPVKNASAYLTKFEATLLDN